jgi:hypothetical protein
MHKSLVVLAFQKARKERRKIGDNKPSLKKIAEDLAAEIDYRVGERSLRDYYNNAKKLNAISQDINIGQLTVVDGLSKYLGFQDYEDFASSIVQNPVEKEEKKSVIIIKEGQKDLEPRPEIQIKNSVPGSNNNIKIWLKKNKSVVIIIPIICFTSIRP